MEPALDRNAIAAMCTEYMRKIAQDREELFRSAIDVSGSYGLTQNPAANDSQAAAPVLDAMHFLFPGLDPDGWIILSEDAQANTDMLRAQLDDALTAARDHPDHNVIFWRIPPRLDLLLCVDGKYHARIASRFSLIKEAHHENPQIELAAGAGHAVAQGSEQRPA